MRSPSRVGLVHLSLALFAIALIAKSASVQLLQRSRWTASAQRQQSVESTIPAPRGDILDALGETLAQSREIVKLEVAPHAVLDADVDVLLAALRDSGLPSLYSSDRAKSTITALQRVTRGPSVTTEMSEVPVELFVADQVIVSRIVGLARYEVLDTASIPTSG